MPLLYKLYQDTRKKKGTETPLNTKTYEKWFARPCYIATIESQEIAEKVAYSASATVADTLSVIKALVQVMSDNLQKGYVVQLDNFGRWSIGLKTTPALEASAFTANNNIKGCRCNFLPYYTIDSATGKKNCPMVKDASLRETVKNTNA